MLLGESEVMSMGWRYCEAGEQESKSFDYSLL